MSGTIRMESSSDVLVIGGGFAGMYAALAASEKGAQVRLLCKSRTGGSGNSVVAMSVHRFAPDAPGLREEYRGRFLASGAGQQIADTAEYFVDESAGYVEALKRYGLPLEYRCLQENGKDYPYLACCRPKQGRILAKALREVLEKHPAIDIEDDVMVCDIVCREGRACGVLALRDEEYVYYPASSVILAAGGGGNVYASTSNTSDVTGDGYGMAARCGLPLTGMEFVQFYPYRIYSPGRADIFPDIFDHGAVFRNEKGERFMDCDRYPKKELENRDVVARAMFGQKEVRLDLTDCDMEYLERECPNIRKMYLDNPEKPLLLRPVAHFLMGGVPLRKDTSTEVEGLYVCGETAGGLHGANRLAGSALSECVMFGTIAGREAAGFAAAHEAREARKEAEALLSGYPESGTDDLRPLRQRVRESMWEKVSLLRSEEPMKECLRELESAESEFRALHPQDPKQWHELRNLLCTARAVTEAALARKESLGAHCRTDE